MSHTYISELFHIVFSTKERRHSIPPNMQDRLWAFLGGIARRSGFKAIGIGGTDNHVHMLLSIPATMPLSKAMQLLKGGSSKWLNQAALESPFEWQQGYGAFSVSVSHQRQTIVYINSQAEHHRTRNFEDEFVSFLKKHEIDYDPKYVLG